MQRTALRVAGLLVSVLLAVSVAGCKKVKKGGSCTGGKGEHDMQGDCVGKGGALVCINGSYTEIKCDAAPVGCMVTMGSVGCNQIVDEGEPCFGDKEFGCSTDNKKMLKCKKNVWKLEMACKGSTKGCIDNADGVSCESGEAEEGDECKQKDSGSCSPDKSKLLVCDGEKFYVASTCRGQLKCRAIASKIQCDTSVAEIDDPCEEEDKLACDVAKKVMLKCDGKKFVKEKECKKRCNNAFDKYSCD
jgi:hypothetical protein